LLVLRAVDRYAAMASGNLKRELKIQFCCLLALPASPATAARLLLCGRHHLHTGAHVVAIATVVPLRIPQLLLLNIQRSVS